MGNKSSHRSHSTSSNRSSSNSAKLSIRRRRTTRSTNNEETSRNVGTTQGQPGNDPNPEIAQECTTDSDSKLSYWQMIRGGYDELVNAIIRPPRAEYDLNMLGPTQFRLNGRVIVRNDFQLTNDRGLKLECSHWQARRNTQQGAKPVPCIVYLHGNASCRAEALECLPIVLSTGISLVAFDFSGSGMSEGEYISLGFFEREDVGTVMKHLRDNALVSSIGIWGRSMGAVTALMHADRDPTIACLVLDSPFTSLRQLAKELVEHAQLSVPKWALGIALKVVRSSVKSRAGFDINKLEPLAHANQCFVPVFFGAAEEDEFIRPHHSQELHDAYGGSKNITLFPGDHNSSRPSFFLHSVSIFLMNTMVTPFGLTPEQLTGGTEETANANAQEWEDAAPSDFHMPSPLSPSGAGIGIDVGIPQGLEELSSGINQYYFADEGPSDSQDEDAYYEAMIMRAIEESYAEQRRSNGVSEGDVVAEVPSSREGAS